MGIDVHFFIENKNESGKWEWMEGYEDILGRDSDLFTLINGVKDTGIKGRLKKEEMLPVGFVDDGQQEELGLESNDLWSNYKKEEIQPPVGYLSSRL